MGCSGRPEKKKKKIGRPFVSCFQFCTTGIKSYVLFDSLVSCRTAHPYQAKTQTLCSQRYAHPYEWHFNLNTPIFLSTPQPPSEFDTLPLWSFSKLWQLLFMERSALLSHPPSSESDPEDSEQVPTSQSCPLPVTPGNVEAREPEPPSQPELERSSRPEERPAVEGCVDMSHRN